MLENKRLGSEEFIDTLLELTSPNILSNFYINKYPEFTKNLFFDLWKDYHFSPIELPVRHYAILLEIFFINLFSYESSSEKDHEVII
jgi:hypothetical protein